MGLLTRIGAAIGTGGTSEIYRAARGRGIEDDIQDELGYGPQDLTGLEQAKAVPASIREQLMAERNQPGYTPERIQATGAGYTDPGQATLAQTTGRDDASGYSATQIQKPRDVQVGTLAPVERVDSRDTSISPVAHRAGFQEFGGAKLDASAANQESGRQSSFLDLVQGRAEGKGPSVAESSYLSKLGDVTQNVMGVAGQARGSDRAYAKLQAMRDIADQTRRAAMDAGTLRATETATATGQLGQAVAQKREQDTGLATTQAQLDQQSGLQNQSLRTGVEQGNVNALNRRDEIASQIAAENAARDLQAKSLNANTANDRTLSEAQLRAGVDTGNVGRGLAVDTANAGATTDASRFGAAARNERASEMYQAGNAVNLANAGTINKRAEVRADGRNQTEQFNATAQNQAAQSNQTAGLQGSAQETQRRQGLAGGALTASGQEIGLEEAKLAGEQKNAESKRKFVGDVVDAGSTVAASDERVKKDVDPVADKAAKKLADVVARSTIAFKYKPGPEDDGGQQHFGVKAQDLERDPLGRKLVSKGPDGIRKVDYQGLTSILLAAALRGKKEARA